MADLRDRQIHDPAAGRLEPGVPPRMGVLYQPHIPAARELAMILDARLREHGVDTWLESAWEQSVIEAEVPACDMLITLGGDGTILRAARATAECERRTPPLLTVDFGRLGFLAELQPGDAVGALPRVLAGDYWLEERHVLSVEQYREGTRIAHAFAINDVVLARDDGPHVLSLGVKLDGVHVTNYVADGIIVATPTGSTAYAYAAGGPILAPTLDGTLVIPVAPHLTLTRALVVPARTVVEVRTLAHHTAVVAVDGQRHFPWQQGDRLRVTRGERVVRFVRLESPHYFYATLNARLSKPRDL